MSIDMSTLKQTFLEESFEGLETMENLVLSINVEEPDDEEINSIFRSIHSIKGGAGTFGFDDIVGLTHTYENILDEIRNKTRELTPEICDTFLLANDSLRDILTAYSENESPSDEDIKKITELLNAIQSGENLTDKRTENTAQAPHRTCRKVQIEFKPNEGILNLGNEPIRIIRELSCLGNLESEIITDSIPTIESDKSKITLHWKITITGEDIDLQEVEELFEWVTDDCELLTITPSYETSETQPQKSSVDKKTPTKNSTTSSIRVDTNKLDSLVNLVGELVITQSMLAQKDSEGKLKQKLMEEALHTLGRQMRELQDSIISVRMVPISAAFNRIPRIVRDTSKALGKEINLTISGEATEVDKTVSEKITDPIVHIIRNAVDHGIEPMDIRLSNGKSKSGSIQVAAYHQGGNLFIDISDDGGGINTEKVRAKAINNGMITNDTSLTDKEINELIFAPGFSTADKVSDVSGRGVGMDVVKRNIHSLKGQIDLYSEYGKGSLFRIKLPLTLAILDGQLTRVGDQVFVLPILSMLESILLEEKNLKTVHGKPSLYKLRDEYIPIIDLFDRFNIDQQQSDDNQKLLVIVEQDSKKFAIKISELLNQQQVVIKNLERNFKNVDSFSGATILGDGTVSLILDLASITKTAEDNLNE